MGYRVTKRELQEIFKGLALKTMRSNLREIKSSKYLLDFIIWFIKYEKSEINRELTSIKHKIFGDKKDSTIKRLLLKDITEDKKLKEDLMKDNLHYHMYDNPSSYFLDMYEKYIELKGRLKELEYLHDFYKSLIYYIENE